jgi:hypothetical protein
MQLSAVPALAQAPLQPRNWPPVGTVAVSVIVAPSTNGPVVVVQPVPQLIPLGVELIVPEEFLVSVSVRTGRTGIVSLAVLSLGFESTPPEVTVALAVWVVELLPLPLVSVACTV